MSNELDKKVKKTSGKKSSGKKSKKRKKAKSEEATPAVSERFST